MDRLRLCRLLLRVIGVMLIGMSLPSALSSSIMLIFQKVPVAQVGFPMDVDTGVSLTAWVVRTYSQFAFGLYLLLGGKFFVNLCARGLGPGCTKCGYDLAGITSEECPECGAERETKQDRR